MLSIRGSAALLLLLLLCGHTELATAQSPSTKSGKIPAKFAWNCQTNGHSGNCGRMERSDASREIVDALDIGVITNFVEDDKAKSILSHIKQVEDKRWVQIDNKKARSFGKQGVKRKATVDMDYKMLDLQLPENKALRDEIEPVFQELFQGPHQKLSLFCGKYSHGSYVTSHTDGAVVTLDGTDRYDRKRAFLLYLNEEWSPEDGGLFTDEEDSGHPAYTPGWNTVLTFRVPRWHLVTPVKAERVRWSVYGWSLEEQKDFFQVAAEAGIKLAAENPTAAVGTALIFLVFGIIAYLKFGASAESPKKD